MLVCEILHFLQNSGKKRREDLHFSAFVVYLVVDVGVFPMYYFYFREDLK